MHRPSRRLWPLIVFLIIILLGTIPLSGESAKDSYVDNLGIRESPQEPGLVSIAELQQMTPQDAVPAAYAKLERLVAASGKIIEINTSDFVLWTKDQFHLLQWSHLTNAPQVPGISTGSRHKSYPDGRRSLSYSANWIPLLSEWQPRPDFSEGRSVDEVLNSSVQHAPWAIEVYALATFRVSLRLEGKALSYQAAMLFREDEKKRLHLHPIDPMIQNLDAAIQQEPELLTDQVVIDPKEFRAAVDAILGDGWSEYLIRHQTSRREGLHTPILIQLSKGSLTLTGLDNPVTFDIDGDGFAETVGWSDPKYRDTAFLAMDRNGNGMIDDGRELFSRIVEHSKSPEAGGLNALMSLDLARAGGNNDGVISEDDAAFEALVLWHDQDHNGLSDPSELVSLRDSGITSISLNMISLSREDAHGNQIRYGATVEFAQLPTHHFGAMDVKLVSSPHQQMPR